MGRILAPEARLVGEFRQGSGWLRKTLLGVMANCSVPPSLHCTFFQMPCFYSFIHVWTLRIRTSGRLSSFLTFSFFLLCSLKPLNGFGDKLHGGSFISTLLCSRCVDTCLTPALNSSLSTEWVTAILSNFPTVFPPPYFLINP